MCVALVFNPASVHVGSFTFSEELPEKVEQGIKKKTAPEDGEKMGKKKKTTRSVSLDEEKAGPSSLHTPRKRKKVQKPSFGESQASLWLHLNLFPESSLTSTIGSKVFNCAF